LGPIPNPQSPSIENLEFHNLFFFEKSEIYTN
jgi:hypothetical protein